MKAINRAYLEIDGVELAAKNVEIKYSNDEKIVEVMNRENRGAGHSFGVVKMVLTAEIPKHIVIDSGVDLEKIMLDETEFTTRIEYEGGEVKSYLDCVIRDLTESAQTGEHASDKVEISALDKA